MEVHKNLQGIEIKDLLVAHANREPPDSLKVDSLRLLVNTGFEEEIVTGNLFEHLVDSDIEELMVDPADLRKEVKDVGLRNDSSALKDTSSSSSSIISFSSRKTLPSLLSSLAANIRESASSSVAGDERGRTLTLSTPSSLSIPNSLSTPTISRTPSLHSLARPVPKSGFLVNLVKHVVLGGDQELMDCLLLTSRTFTSSLVLFRNLVHLFRRKVGASALTVDKEEIVIKRDRVLSFLVRWLSRHPDDFKEHSLLERLQTFIDRQAKGHISLSWEQLTRLLRGEPLVPKAPAPALCNHNVVYQKARDAVFHHQLPVTEEEAITLAAIQFQIENQIESTEYTEE